MTQVAPEAVADGTGQEQVGAPADAEGADADANADVAPAEDPAQTTLSGVAQVQSTIYDSAQSYFAALNADNWWINYNHRSMSVSVSSLRDFVLHLRPAALDASPFDQPDRSSRTNQLFGIGEESTLHFDAIAGGLVQDNLDAYSACEDWPEDLELGWEEDLEKVDSLETDMATRVAMMNPLYWLSGHYEGYGQASVAPHWRVNEGLFDTDVPLATASNIVLALRKYDGVTDIAHTQVWGQGHVLAERSGSATANLISWVTACCTA